MELKQLQNPKKDSLEKGIGILNQVSGNIVLPLDNYVPFPSLKKNIEIIQHTLANAAVPIKDLRQFVKGPLVRPIRILFATLWEDFSYGVFIAGYLPINDPSLLNHEQGYIPVRDLLASKPAPPIRLPTIAIVCSGADVQFPSTQMGLLMKICKRQLHLFVEGVYTKDDALVSAEVMLMGQQYLLLAMSVRHSYIRVVCEGYRRLLTRCHATDATFLARSLQNTFTNAQLVIDGIVQAIEQTMLAYKSTYFEKDATFAHSLPVDITMGTHIIEHDVLTDPKLGPELAAMAHLSTTHCDYVSSYF